MSHRDMDGTRIIILLINSIYISELWDKTNIIVNCKIGLKYLNLVEQVASR